MNQEPKIPVGEKLGRAFLASLIAFFMFAFLSGVSSNRRVSPMLGKVVTFIAVGALLACLTSFIFAIIALLIDAWQNRKSKSN